MKIAIIGAGITGLTCGFKLSQKGHKVSIFEKESFPGGLVSGFKLKNWDWNLENIYHHLFESDKEAIALLKELGILEKLEFKNAKSSVFFRDEISQFDSPVSILKFPYLSFCQKIRVGMASFVLKLSSQNKLFESLKAFKALKTLYGQTAYKIIWKPLLKSKFGKYYKRVSFLWFWARIKKRSFKLGFLNGGFEILIKALTEKVIKNGGKIYLNHEINNIDDLKKQGFDKIIAAIPTPVFQKIVPASPEYEKTLNQTKWIGSLNLILILKEKFLTDNTYWLNINEESFPFLALVEHTNVVSSKSFDKKHILYLGGYYEKDHSIYKKGEKEIFNDFKPFLKKINSNYDFEKNLVGLKKYSCFFSQPVISTNHSKKLLEYKTPLKNIYLCNMEQIYPWDRGVNYAIKEGIKMAGLIEKE